ncbi:MAG: PDZ domain-containing protein [Phycisphaera sp.]|nr:PDZ domain-containing protein [Phycisphaera sp.]
MLSEAALSLVLGLAAQAENRAAQTVPRVPVEVNPRGGVEGDFEIPLGAGAEAGRRVVLPTAPVPALPTDADLSRIDVDGELVRLARQLDAETYAERASARAQIRARRDSPEELMALLLRKDLSPEARNALVAVLESRILHAPRGALGVRMDGFDGRDGGVRITGLIAGMPAERVLQIGDAVLDINGTRIIDRADLIRVVQTLPPAAEVKLVVRRAKRDAAGRPQLAADGSEQTDDIKLSLRLGSTEELDKFGDPAGPAVNAVSLERRARAQVASQRFLPSAQTVEFPDRGDPRERFPPATVQSLRKEIMRLQLAGADPEGVRKIREKLDEIAAEIGAAGAGDLAGAANAAATIEPSSEPSIDPSVQARLETLAAELRSLRAGAGL